MRTAFRLTLLPQYWMEVGLLFSAGIEHETIEHQPLPVRSTAQHSTGIVLHIVSHFQLRTIGLWLDKRCKLESHAHTSH